jgi:hypothetical protein
MCGILEYIWFRHWLHRTDVSGCWLLSAYGRAMSKQDDMHAKVQKVVPELTCITELGLCLACARIQFPVQPCDTERLAIVYLHTCKAFQC